MSHTTSTIIVACRGARRWFDLDAVRHEAVTQEHNDRYAKVGGWESPRQNPNRPGDNSGGLYPIHPAGAPPLDWHHDAPEPGVIALGEPPDDERDDPIALAVKIIDCMCPREVCTVCGVPRERVTSVSYTALENPEQNNAEPKIHRGVGVGVGVHTSGMEYGRAQRNAETLGWTDCGHNAYRKGRVFDPYHNPAIEAACLILDRDYITS